MAIHIDKVTNTGFGNIIVEGNGGEEEAHILWVSRQDGKWSWMIAAVDVDGSTKLLAAPTVGSENKMWATIKLTMMKWMRGGLKPDFDVDTAWLELKQKMESLAS